MVKNDDYFLNEIFLNFINTKVSIFN